MRASGVIFFNGGAMAHRPIFVWMLITAIACATLNLFAAVRQAPPPPPPAQGAGPDAVKVAEAKRLAANISAYARARCGGKDSAAAPDCWAKSLWDATQCPPVDASAKKDAAGDKDATVNKDVASPQAQPCVAGGPGFVYDVVSIKLHKYDGTGNSGMGGSDDGFRGVNVTMQIMVLGAYSTGMQIQITGGPGWLNDEHYDIEAKFVPEVGLALRKLSGDDSNFVRRYMEQQILKERMNLAAHSETKDVPAYDLVIGKSGPKFKEADPNAKDIGRMIMRIDQGKWVVDGRGVLMAGFARNLGQFAGRPVFDKTGLTGRYDIKLEFAREQTLSAGGPAGAAENVPDAPEPAGGPSITAALEDQLGLKLVSSRGPMQVVVIEHVEKPDVN